LDISGTATATQFSGGGVTSGSDPGHTHTTASITGSLTNKFWGTNMLDTLSRAKIAVGGFNHVIINDGSGNLSSEAKLATSRGGSGTDMSGTGPGYVVQASAGAPFTVEAKIPGTNVSSIVTNSTYSGYSTNAGAAVTAGTATNFVGQLSVTNMNSGTGASALTFWKGDGSWGTPITHDAATIGSPSNGLHIVNQELTLNLGITHTVPAYGDHTHTNYLTSITNSGGTHSLIANSNAPIPSLVSISAGANVTITNQGGTNIQVSAASGSSVDQPWLEINLSTISGDRILIRPSGEKKLKLVGSHGSSAFNIYGMTGGSDADCVTILDKSTGTGSVYLYGIGAHGDVGTSITNCFHTTGATLPPSGCAMFFYNSGDDDAAWALLTAPY
jgi:hypothetical protein